MDDPAITTNALEQLRGSLRIAAVMDQHLGPFANQPLDDRRTDAARASGHQHDLPSQGTRGFTHTCSPSVVENGKRRAPMAAHGK
ncbi:hypothetical protein D9M71_419190 [compost metagenome]